MALKARIGAEDEHIEPILDYMWAVAEHQEIYFLWRPLEGPE